MTTLGRQSKLEEGHYLHHFSINPQNLKDLVSLAGEGAQTISDDDIKKLKEAMRRGATWYDSASKAGCENEMLVWIQLKDNSKNVIPSLVTLVELKPDKDEGKCVYDFSKLKTALGRISDDVDLIEIYYNDQTIKLENLPDGVKKMNI